jgi:hypothetical protein
VVLEDVEMATLYSPETLKLIGEAPRSAELELTSWPAYSKQPSGRLQKAKLKALDRFCAGMIGGVGEPARP